MSGMMEGNIERSGGSTHATRGRRQKKEDEIFLPIQLPLRGEKFKTGGVGFKCQCYVKCSFFCKVMLCYVKYLKPL